MSTTERNTKKVKERFTKQQKDRERAIGEQRKIHTAIERDIQGKREKGRQSDRAANQYVPLSHPSILLESANHVETLPCCRSITLEPPIPPPSRLSNPSGKTFHERLNTKRKQLGTPHPRPAINTKPGKRDYRLSSRSFSSINL